MNENIKENIQLSVILLFCLIGFTWVMFKLVAPIAFFLLEGAFGGNEEPEKPWIWSEVKDARVIFEGYEVFHLSCDKDGKIIYENRY